MKKNTKKIIGLFLIIISIFAFKINIKADNRITSSFPSSITADYSGIVTQDGVNIYNKGYNNTARAFCTFFWNDFKTGTCSATWWNQDATENKKIAVAVGAMINKARSLSGGSAGSIDTDVYFYTEMAINHFLYNYNGKHGVNNVSKLKNWSTVSSRATYKAIYSAGTTAYNDFGKNTAKFSNLTITDDGNGKITATADFACYNSNGNKIACAARCKKTAKIKVTYSGGTEETISDINSTCPRVTNDPVYRYTAEHTFTIPENNTISKVEVTFDTINYTSYPVAQEYYCGSSNYQNLTPNLLKTIDHPYQVKKTITKTTDYCSINLKKVSGSTPLSGAQFKLYSDAGATNEIDSGTTDSNGIVTFDGLLNDTTYYYREVKAPKGYILDNTVQPVTCANAPKEVSNTPATGSLTIKKVDGEGNAVAGAKIRVYTISSSGSTGSSHSMPDSDGYEGNDNGDYTASDNNNYEIHYMIFGDKDYFITTGEPKVITGLSLDETYYVEEEAVPEGSDYAIKVSSDSVKIVEAKNYDVTLINIHSNFKISKQDITSKKELPGAEIVITDIYGNEIEKWTSTEVPHEIKGLADGEYILTEITAPKGYKKAESIRFTIEDGKLKDDDDNTLVMYDDTSVFNIPDTLSARNILIILSGMAIVAAGIGIFLYGVKRKDQI